MNRSGLIDFMFTDRRDKFDVCIYWKTDKEILDAYGNKIYNKLDYVETEPSGSFYGKLYSPQYFDKNIVGNSFMFDEEIVSIITDEDLSDLKINDIIKFRNEIYRVDTISKKPKRKNNQFNDEVGYSYIINLKR